MRAYVITVFCCAVAVAVLLPCYGLLAPVNIAMLLLLLVALIAVRLGRGPAIVASVIGVLAFDLGFVPPRGSLTVEDGEYLIVFAVMLVVALIVSQISGNLRERTVQTQLSLVRQRHLYELAAALNASLRDDQVIAVVREFLARELDAVTLFHPAPMSPGSVGSAAMACDPRLWSVHSSGLMASDRDGSEARPLREVHALKGATRGRGVLELHLPCKSAAETASRSACIAVVAGLTAAALERLHYLEVAARVQTEVEAERLRNALLSSLSHDLRTPLTVLYAKADRLRAHAADHPQLEIAANGVCEEALRVSRLSESLLDLARLRSTPNLLQCDWVALEEVIGAALAGLRGLSGIEQLRVAVPEELPWLQLDSLMFERVIANLVDNALKQGDASQQVSITAQAEAATVILVVANSGSRFSDDVLASFHAAGAETGQSASVVYGLGLSICRAVIEAHGGHIELCNAASEAQVIVSLPVPAQAMSQPPPEADGSDAGGLS